MGSRTPYKGLTGHKALALAVIHQATKEMGDTRPSSTQQLGRDKLKLRIEATVWLASTQATGWFEGCGLDQGYALGRMRWASHARELLDDESVFLGHERARVLELGLASAGPTE